MLVDDRSQMISLIYSYSYQITVAADKKALKRIGSEMAELQERKNIYSGSLLQQSL